MKKLTKSTLRKSSHRNKNSRWCDLDFVSGTFVKAVIIADSVHTITQLDEIMTFKLIHMVPIQDHPPHIPSICSVQWSDTKEKRKNDDENVTQTETQLEQNPKIQFNR